MHEDLNFVTVHKNSFLKRCRKL